MCKESQLIQGVWRRRSHQQNTMSSVKIFCKSLARPEKTGGGTIQFVPTENATNHVGHNLFVQSGGPHHRHNSLGKQSDAFLDCLPGSKLATTFFVRKRQSDNL